jgi:hypothetical protein
MLVSTSTLDHYPVGRLAQKPRHYLTGEAAQ